VAKELRGGALKITSLKMKRSEIERGRKCA